MMGIEDKERDKKIHVLWRNADLKIRRKVVSRQFRWVPCLFMRHVNDQTCESAKVHAWA